MLKEGKTYTVTITLKANENIDDKTMDETLADAIYDIGGECIDISEYNKA